MSNKTKLQQEYFDRAENRYQTEFLLKPKRSTEAEMEALLSKTQVTTGMKVIDFGAGSGRLTLFLLKRGIDVLAVDVSEKSLHALQEIYQKWRKPSWGRLTVATKLPAKASVQAVMGTDILHHVTISKILPQMVMSVKPGGILAFSEPNAWFGLWYVYLWLKRVPWQVEKGILQCTFANLKKIFQREDLEAVKVAGFGVMAYRLQVSARRR